MAGPTAANCKLGPATTVTIAGNSYYMKGAASCGIEGDVTFGTVDQYPVPFASKYGSMQPYIKVTLGEVVAALLSVIWDAADVASDLTPTDKDPTSRAVSVAYANGTFSLTAGIATDFGEITAGDGDNVTVDATFKGIDPDMTGGTGTWA